MSLSFDFGKEAEFYDAYRPSVPDEIVDELSALVGDPADGVAVDLGAGTGQLTIPLAQHFTRVVAMEKDPEMVRLARKRLEDLDKKQGGRIEFVVANAEDFRSYAPDSSLIAVCRAFHWMDQESILLDGLKSLRPGGVFAILGDGSLWTGESDWQIEIKNVIKSFLGETRRAGTKKFDVDKEPYVDKLSRLGYRDVSAVRREYERAWDFQSILGYLYSTSFASRSLFGDRLDDFEHVLYEALGRPDSRRVYVESVRFSIQYGRSKADQ